LFFLSNDTARRPENLDDPFRFAGILIELKKSLRTYVFPMHPRTQKMVREFFLLNTRNPGY
jgi:hypothetical protein